MENYYEILGVSPTAEIEVIKAAYRALSKKYHPDKTKDSKSIEKMKRVNLAFEVLSTPNKRKEYDEKFGFGANFDFENNDIEGNSSILEDWDFILDYHPELGELESKLKELSVNLGSSFQYYMLDKKAFNNAHSIAEKMETDFLKQYFGTNIRIQQFAKTQILDRNREVALEINKAVNLLGVEASESTIINTIHRKFPELNTDQSSGFNEGNFLLLILILTLVILPIVLINL